MSLARNCQTHNDRRDLYKPLLAGFFLYIRDYALLFKIEYFIHIIYCSTSGVRTRFDKEKIVKKFLHFYKRKSYVNHALNIIYFLCYIIILVRWTRRPIIILLLIIVYAGINANRAHPFQNLKSTA